MPRINLLPWRAELRQRRKKEFLVALAGSLVVACGVVSIGVVSAWLVASYRFPGSRLLEWALVLPLAMPAYVMAYAYTDWLQFAGRCRAHCAR